MQPTPRRDRLLRLVSLSPTRSRSLSCGAGIKTICTSRKSIMLIPISATQIYTPARPRSARSAALSPSYIEAHTSHCGPLSYLSKLVVNSRAANLRYGSTTSTDGYHSLCGATTELFKPVGATFQVTPCCGRSPPSRYTAVRSPSCPSLMRSIHSYHAVSQSLVKADQRRSHHHRSRTRTAMPPRRDLRAFVLAEPDACARPSSLSSKRSRCIVPIQLLQC